MKKAIALFLCLLMTASLVACSSNDTVTGESQTSQVETEISDNNNDSNNGNNDNNDDSNNKPTTSEETKPSTEAETETPTENTEPVYNDSGWEISDSVIPIPEPPATQYHQYQKRERDEYFTHFIVWLDSDEVKSISEDSLKAYINEVKAAGYDQIVTELKFDENKSFLFEAYKKDGVSNVTIEGTLSGGNLAITVDEPV